jgi:alkylhydroperoxidase/carboxymuconolactone decarboxylase family protein YurZ
MMATTDVDARRQELRAAFSQARGHWNPGWEGLLTADADFFETYLDLSAHPWRNGVLEPKVKEFVLIAVDGATTHLFGPGLKTHIGLALEYGASVAEVMEVLELTSVMGIHTCNVGVPILMEELAAAGLSPEPESLTARQEEIKADFTTKRGYWNETWDALLRLDPEFLAAYTRFSGHPWENGVLEPKVKELIYTAFDASTTHLFEPGLRQHIRNALALGATKEEIMEVLELTSIIGIHTCSVGVPLLQEAAAAHAAANGATS